MRRLLLLPLLVLASAGPLAAQRPEVRFALGQALAHYREQNDVLDFRGHATVGRVDVTWRRWGLVTSVGRYTFTPTDAEVNYLVGFRATETQVAVRYRPLRKLPADVELGTIRRTATPGDNAQAFRAFRAGVLVRLPLADGAELEPRAAWLLGSKFSGGGSATTALTLGLRAVYRPVARFGWGWLMMDYSYERFERRTDLPVPLQGSSVAFGLEVRKIP